ncbi:MAG: S-formylglutathione hydrolase [Prochlorothrix sp.]
MTAPPTLLTQQVCFGGKVEFYQHASSACNGDMKFAVYQPPQAKSEAVPVLYFLSGLTCTDENFMIKAGAQRYAAEHGLMLVAPDTSPRGTGIAQEDEEWDLGSGASFYVDATEEPWAAHYQMYSYITEELPALMVEHFPARPDRQGIFGHSMGGHGALVCALRNRDRFRSVSAFAPIAAPSQSPWGQKAFSHYLGSDAETWKAYDASELVLKVPYNRPILIDQGTADPFLNKGQLQVETFEAACTQVGQPLTLRRQVGYDHSYFFIATFMADHIQHHASALCR